MTIKTASECQSAATALGYSYASSGSYSTTYYPVGCFSYPGYSGNFYFQEDSGATTSCNPPADTSGYVSKCVCRVPDHQLDFRHCRDGVATTDDKDSSITATAKNGATCSEEGMVFDGNDDYVDVTPWAFGGEPITVEFYLKFDALNDWSRIFEFYKKNEYLVDYFHFSHRASGSPVFGVYHDPSNGWRVGSTTNFFATGVWVHVVATIDGTTMNIYKNW